MSKIREFVLAYDGLRQKQRETFKENKIDKLIARHALVTRARRTRISITLREIDEKEITVDEIRELKPAAEQIEDKRDPLSKGRRRNKVSGEERAVDLNRVIQAEQDQQEADEPKKKRGKK